MNRGALTAAAFAAAFALGLLAPRADAAFTYTDLGTLGGTDSFGFAINTSGQVVGQSITASVSMPTGNPTGAGGGAVYDHAFVSGINGGPLTDLGTLGGPTSVATGINASGVVVGSANTAATIDPTNQVFVNHAFISGVNGGPLRDLGTLAGTSAANSQANGINATGQVVGVSDTSTLGVSHAFISGVNGGALRDLGTLAGAGTPFANSVAYAINATGQVTGQSDLANGTSHAFLSAANGGALADLGTLGGSYSVGFKVNASGEVVGAATTANDAALHAFVYTGSGTLIDLGTLGGTNSTAYAITNSGVIVGSADTAAGISHAFYDSGGVMKDLNSLISPGSGLVLTDARGINDAGQIVAFGTDANGFNHVVLINTNASVPEPASLAMTGIGLLLGLAARARRSAA